VQQQKTQREQDLTMMRKVLSRSIASAHLSSIKDRVLGHLGDAGVFTDPMQNAVEHKFLPQLLDMVNKQMEQMKRSQQLISEAMESVVSDRTTLHSATLETERRRLALIDEAERKAREEFDKEQAALQADAKRLESERQEMAAWEEYQAPKVEEAPPEIHIVQVVEDDDGKAAILADGTRISVSEEKFAELQEHFTAISYPDGKWEEGSTQDKIMATLSSSGDEQTIETLSRVPFEEATGGDAAAPQDAGDQAE
jgi:hypothetical protein